MLLFRSLSDFCTLRRVLSLPDTDAGGFLNRLVGELNVHALGDGVGDALHSEEALVVSEGSDAENFSLIRVGCQRQGLRNVDACYLEQSSFKGALFLISGNGIQHGSCQCGTPSGTDPG